MGRRIWEALETAELQLVTMPVPLPMVPTVGFSKLGLQLHMARNGPECLRQTEKK